MTEIRPQDAEEQGFLQDLFDHAEVNVGILQSLLSSNRTENDEYSNLYLALRQRRSSIQARMAELSEPGRPNAEDAKWLTKALISLWRDALPTISDDPWQADYSDAQAMDIQTFTLWRNSITKACEHVGDHLYLAARSHARLSNERVQVHSPEHLSQAHSLYAIGRQLQRMTTDCAAQLLMWQSLQGDTLASGTIESPRIAQTAKEITQINNELVSGLGALKKLHAERYPMMQPFISVLLRNLAVDAFQRFEGVYEALPYPSKSLEIDLARLERIKTSLDAPDQLGR